jgi:4-amino-4-deoxy-L-arabinose transferase-like glycosyltransferase
MVDEVSTSTRVPAALTVVALAALGTAWFWHLGEPFSYDYDEGVYLVSARLLLHGHRLFQQVFSSQPPLYLELLHAAFRSFGDTVAVGRGVSVAFAVAACALLAKASWDSVHPRAAPVAVVLCGTALSFFREARVCQAEMPALGLAVAAIASLASERRACRTRWQLGSGILFGLALATKLFVAPMVFPLLVMVLGPSGAHRSRAQRLRGGLLVLGSAGATAIAIASCFRTGDLYRQVVGFHLDARAPLSWWPAHHLWSGFFLMEGLLAPLAAVGFTSLALRRSGATTWSGAWLGTCAVFLWVHTPLFPHHFVLLVPPLALMGSSVVSLGPSAKWRLPAVVLAITAVALLKAEPTDRGWRLRPAPRTWARILSPPHASAEEQAVLKIAQLTSPGELVATDEQMLAFRAGRDTPTSLCDTSFVRIAAGSLTSDAAIRALSEVKVVVPWTGRLARLPAFIDTVRERFDLVLSVPVEGVPERGIYVARRRTAG